MMMMIIVNNDDDDLTWMAVSEATMAGEPKPWVIMEKWVRWRCMLGSRMGWGRVLHRGDLSWFSRSISSFVINLFIERID